MEGKSQQGAAAASGMSVRTARTWQTGRLPSEKKGKRWWRTRPDPFAGASGLRERKPYRTYDPVVLYAYELDKVLFRIERAGFVVYSVLSVREYANYHGLELRFAKGLMVITQLAELEGRYLTDAEMVEELQLAGFLDDIADIDDLSPGRPAE